MRPRETYIGLDAVRFGAALAVAIYHLGYWWWLPDQGRPVETAFHSAFAPIASFARWGYVGVPIFFVLSGFIIAASASGRTWGDFLKGRALRLYPAIWICALPLLLAQDSDAGVAGTFLRTVVLWPFGPWLSGVLWTLAIEVIFYVLVALSLAFRVRLWTFGQTFGAVGSIYWLARAADFATGGHAKSFFLAVELDPLGGLLLVQNCYFAVGIALWSMHAGGLTLRKLILFSIFVCAGLVSAFASGRFMISEHGGVLLQALNPAAIWLAALVLTVCSIRFQPLLWRYFSGWAVAIRTVGLATYPLYLFHSEVGRFLMVRLSGLGPWTALAIAMSAVVLASFIVVALERWPRSMLRALLHGPPRREEATVTSDLP